MLPHQQQIGKTVSNAQVYLQLQEPHSGQMKALRSSLEKARELKNAQSAGAAGAVDKSQQQMIMELYMKCAQLKVLVLFLKPSAMAQYVSFAGKLNAT